MDKYDILKRVFGHSEFREGQSDVIDALLDGRDALAVMPTGAGKSVCYQIPALMRGGITIVISPLISLMEDQVSALRQAGIPAAYINSTLQAAEYRYNLSAAREGRLKLLYVAPERLGTEDFTAVCAGLDIDLIAVDEAHCISQWGQDFRPSYRGIPDFCARLKKRPAIGAFTATATRSVSADIEKLLQLRSPLTVTTGFDRPNLYFEVRRPESKLKALADYIARHPGKSGIVYCNTRKSVEEVFAALCRRGHAVTRYHAGLSDDERAQNQYDFICDRKPVIVATNAFGMGIDKSNVSYVIHYNMPMCMENYYQEAGRAGRDGESADCILFYSGSDVYTNKYIIEHGEQDPATGAEEGARLRERDMQRLKTMTAYCKSRDCLRSFILRYFNDEGKTHCSNCSNCSSRFTRLDITTQAQKILSCVARAGQRFGAGVIIMVLRGSKNTRIATYELNSLSTYGIMRDTGEAELRRMIDALEGEGLLVSEGEYPVLRLTPGAREVLSGSKKVYMRIPTPEEKAPDVKRASYIEDGDLMLRLKKLRTELAARARVPAYMVFSDAALRSMCELMPSTLEGFMQVSGVGEKKCEKYGADFLAVINGKR